MNGVTYASMHLMHSPLMPLFTFTLIIKSTSRYVDWLRLTDQYYATCITEEPNNWNIGKYMEVNHVNWPGINKSLTDFTAYDSDTDRFFKSSRTWVQCTASPIVNFFSCVTHVWGPGTKTTGPIVKKFFSFLILNLIFMSLSLCQWEI
jgi:hypothetical protein